jgi:hypothetical protein
MSEHKVVATEPSPRIHNRLRRNNNKFISFFDMLKKSADSGAANRMAGIYQQVSRHSMQKQ